MGYILVGILVNTHALKGEVRIISDFDYKDRVFVINNKVYIGPNKKEYIINTYRKHKNYDMVTFAGLNSITDVISLKGMKVYYNKADLKLNDNEYLDEDIIGMEVIYENKVVGIINDIEKNNGNKLFVINNSLIPYNDNFIEKIDKEHKKITLKNLNGLI